MGGHGVRLDSKMSGWARVRVGGLQGGWVVVLKGDGLAGTG